MASINLTDEMLQGVLSAAIVNALNEADRKELIRGAVSHLLTPEKSSYGNQQSPISRAFNNAAEAVARKYVETELAENAEFQGKIKGLLAETVSRVFDDAGTREKVISNMVEAVCKAMTRDRY